MGERLGRYMVLKHLASGGMADVLLARTDGIEGFERHVVLKRIRAEHAKDQRFIDMFLDEARLAANLHHQNIVQVHDIGESAGEYFFAMEYLHGEDLRAMLSVVSKTRTHMPLGTVVSVISSVAAGLHYAHERRGPDKKPLNIVHRDVSPSNILVSYDGSVKIVDFGIAKAAMRQVETRSGSLKGKVSYMSPEQCKMGTVDRRSDVYALGVVLYELATTTRLFKSDSDYLVMDAICTGKIPLPRVRRPDLPNELSTIIMTALAVEPERRYQTADELRSALDAFAMSAGLSASASTIGAYVQKLCGEKPEPWLDTNPVEEKSGAYAETLAGSLQETAAGGTRTGTEAKTITDGKGRRTPAAPMPVVAAPGEPETHTSTKLGWEKSLPTAPGRSVRPAKIAMIAIPMFAIAGLVAWRLAVRSETAPTSASPTAASTMGAGVMPQPAAPTPPTPPPTPPPPTAVAATPTTTEKPATVEAKRTAATKPSLAATAKPSAATATAKPSVATVPPATTAAPPKPAAASTTTPKPQTAVASPSPTKAAASSSPAPKPVDPKAVTTTTPTTPATTTAAAPAAPPAMATLAPGVVEGLASRNRKALLACEGKETLQGEVTVRFQIDADGKVAKASLHTTVGKPNVSGCILSTVKSWRFPKPATGAATGVYTISFQ